MNEIKSLPLDVEGIAKQNDWNLLEIQNNTCLINYLAPGSANKNAFLIYYRHYYLIFYNINLVQEDKRILVAHEFGHIVFEHYEKPQIKQYEKEAKMFAYRTTMPICVLKSCKSINAESISRLCGVPITAAKEREKRINLLDSRNKHLTSKLEVLVKKQFDDFIVKNKN